MVCSARTVASRASSWIEQAQIPARGGDTLEFRRDDDRRSRCQMVEEQASAGRTSDLAASALRSLREPIVLARMPRSGEVDFLWSRMT